MSPILSRDPLADPEPLIRRVYAYVAYRLGDGADAEDVTSEVFERALRYRDSYTRAKGEPIAWLLGIARRCADTALAERVNSTTGLVETPATGDVESDALRRLELGAALAQLGKRDRELVALRFGADLTAAQMAEIIGQRTNAVEVGLHRALARLRAILSGEVDIEASAEVASPQLR